MVHGEQRASIIDSRSFEPSLFQFVPEWNLPLHFEKHSTSRIEAPHLTQDGNFWPSSVPKGDAADRAVIEWRLAHFVQGLTLNVYVAPLQHKEEVNSGWQQGRPAEPAVSRKQRSTCGDPKDALLSKQQARPHAEKNLKLHSSKWQYHKASWALLGAMSLSVRTEIAVKSRPPPSSIAATGPLTSSGCTSRQVSPERSHVRDAMCWCYRMRYQTLAGWTGLDF
ncbi:hypothetical protein FZEAL_9980 [Fusarium zealandicum]|uniref:Uncharacterized protein n=1 Tax=Fusarium zealandicum TaxID=1053134 RepID=A0A8H4U6I7_9HYPO|nr:hypothetical protein FZEAL_9980 [Fusarium zealandicum]